MDRVMLYILLAPVTEELIKAAVILVVARDPEFTYFVDGAIYGFASGIGFSITESFVYVTQHPDIAIPLALVRAFSTSLMHGSASALVGAAIGRFRLEERVQRRWMVAGAWVSAILIHILFNIFALAARGIAPPIPMRESTGVLLGLTVGLAGLTMIVAFILLGLREEQGWLVESIDFNMLDEIRADLTAQEQEWLTDTLDEEAGVSIGEVRASQAYEMLETVLAPITSKFPHRAKQMREIVLRQAQIGIKRRVEEELDDQRAKDTLRQEIERLEQETKQLRKEAGAGAITYLQCVFDPNNPDIGQCLEHLVGYTEPSHDAPEEE
jgi:hypothetical protein